MSPFFKSLKAQFAPSKSSGGETPTVKKREPIQASSARRFSSSSSTSSQSSKGETPTNKMRLFGKRRSFSAR